MSDICIRRWYAAWTTCKCAPCQRSRRHRRKLVEAGLVTRTSSDAAWEALDRMVASEWSAAAISSACRITPRCAESILTELRAGHRRQIGPVIAGRIVNHGQPVVGYVGAVGIRRKVRALAVMGHSQKAIAEAADLPLWTTVAAIQRGDTQRVSPRVAAAIDQAWRTLTQSVGSSQRTVDRAVKAGWAGVGAWEDIDDPREEPWRMPASPPRKKGRSGEAVQLISDGMAPEQAAREAGVSMRTVERAIHRAREAA